MPRLDQANDSDAKLKLLLIGDSKAGKTPWSGLAAMNYNVLYLDGDVGLQSLNKMPAEAKSRLFYIPCQDYVDDNGQYHPRFAEFFKTFTTEGTYTWNDTRGETFSRRDYVFGESTDDVWQIKPARMDHSCVLIIDSWTALVQSVMQWKADDLNTDLGDVEKVSREIYSGVGNKLTQFLTMIRSMPCHVIVIAHPAEYTKLEKPIGKIGSMKEVDMKIEWTKMIPKSSSNPHALTMAKYFSDVGWLDVRANGDTRLDFKQATNRIIGGHMDSQTDARETSVAQVIQAIGGHVPPDPKNISHESWLTIYPSGSFEPAGGKKPLALGTKSLTPTNADGTPTPGPVLKTAVGGLAGLLGKPKSSGVEPGLKS